MLDDDWFTFHPPTATTSPRYEAIRHAESETRTAVTAILRRKYTPETRVAVHNDVNDVCHRYALTIDQEAPDCADKTVAIRCVRHLRMLINEYLVQSKLDLLEAGRMDSLIVEARMWANAAIAITHTKRLRKEAEDAEAIRRIQAQEPPKVPTRTVEFPAKRGADRVVEPLVVAPTNEVHNSVGIQETPAAPEAAVSLDGTTVVPNEETPEPPSFYDRYPTRIPAKGVLMPDRPDWVGVLDEDQFAWVVATCKANGHTHNWTRGGTLPAVCQDCAVMPKPAVAETVEGTNKAADDKAGA